MGFEPTVPVRYDGFQDRSVMTASVSLRIANFNNLAYKYYHIKKYLSISFLIFSFSLEENAFI